MILIHLQSIYSKNLNSLQLILSKKILNSNENMIKKILKKIHYINCRDEIYKHFRQEILPVYKDLEKEHDLLMKKYLENIINNNPNKIFFC